jgi:two-component system response regulator FixJ
MANDPVIHIVDDNQSIRNSLNLLMRSAGIQSREYASGREFVENYVADTPGCLLLDVRMPDMSGLDLQEMLPKYNINLPVIIMTGYADVPTAIRAMKMGAIDFVEKPFDHDLLFDSIRTCIETSVSRQTDESYKQSVDKLDLLTAREREVLDLLVAGRINKVIAAELGISTRTVESHRAKIMEKLGVKSISEMVRIAIFASARTH